MPNLAVVLNNDPLQAILIELDEIRGIAARGEMGVVCRRSFLLGEAFGNGKVKIKLNLYGALKNAAAILGSYDKSSGAFVFLAGVVDAAFGVFRSEPRNRLEWNFKMYQLNNPRLLPS